MSITAVPLLPVQKGTLTKLWIGVAACVVLGIGMAVAGTKSASGTCGAHAFLPASGHILAPITTPSGLRYQVVAPGTGASPTEDDVALIAYKGSLTNGTVFDQSERTPMPVGGSIPGFTEGLKHMQRGGQYRLCIPAKLGYGDKAMGGDKIPANSTLLFEVGLIDFKSMAELQAAYQAKMQHTSNAAPNEAGAPPGL